MIRLTDMGTDPFRQAIAEVYLLSIASAEAWNVAPVTERAERLAETYLGLVQMLNGMSESLLELLPELERADLFQRARTRIADRVSQCKANGQFQ